VSGAEQALATLRDYVERSTHWREGGATRHDALAALAELADDARDSESGIAQWRTAAQTNARHAEAARATGRVAIEHLQAVLNNARTHYDQQRADTAARDWLISVGSDPD
jgi:hypothetical protein